MRKIIVGLLAVAILAGGTIFVSAQAFGGRGGFGRGHHGGEFLGRMFDRLADELELTQEQRQQARQVLEDSKTRVEPLMRQIKQTHDELKNLGHDGKFDEARVTQLAAQQAETTKQLIVEKERTKAALFAILTPAQREEAEKLRANFEQKIRERIGKRGEGFLPPQF